MSLEERVEKLEKERMTREKWGEWITKIYALFITLMSIPMFLRGKFLIDWSLAGIMLGVIQWSGVALCLLMFFDFVRSYSHSSEQVPKATEGDEN